MSWSDFTNWLEGRPNPLSNSINNGLASAGSWFSNTAQSLGNSTVNDIGDDVGNWTDKTLSSGWQGIQDVLGIGNSSARSQAQQNRDFQLYMSNTAIQRRAKDLAAAGMNPILAINNGSAAATTESGSPGYGGQDHGALATLFATVAKLIK